MKFGVNAYLVDEGLSIFTSCTKLKISAHGKQWLHNYALKNSK